MTKFFQLIDLESGNVAGDFDTEDEMRSFLKDAQNRYGSDQILDYGVAEMDETGHIYRACFLRRADLFAVTGSRHAAPRRKGKSMKSGYSVFELESGNLAGDYPNIELAMTALVQFQRAHGSAQLADYGLLEIREDGELGESWGDEALIEKVNEFANRSSRLSRTA